MFARSKVGKLPVFRLLQNPTRMFMSDKVRARRVKSSPAGGWGITTVEVRLS